MIGNTNSNADKITLRNGGRNDPNDGTWGTITPANGYTQEVVVNHNVGGGDGGFIMATKDGQTSIQIDGYFYQNEGNTRVASYNVDVSINRTNDGLSIPNYPDGGTVVWATFNFNTWFGGAPYDMIITVKNRNRQNTTVFVGWNPWESGNYFCPAQHWDDNNGYGVATMTFLVPMGCVWGVWTDTARNDDGASRAMAYTLRQR